MRAFERGDIVRVPFPYTDRDTRQHRPALVVSDGGLGDRDSLLWVLMITSAENRAWPGDVSLAQGYEEVGLPAPSLIRTTKIATIERDRAEPLGRLNAERMTIVEQFLGRNLGLDAEQD
jgi:mRNA interferase MazF